MTQFKDDNIREDFPSRTLYAKLEQSNSIQDYYPLQNCVRLIGVSEDSFQRTLFNSKTGCATYIIDIGRGDSYTSRMAHRGYARPFQRFRTTPLSIWTESLYFEDDPKSAWWKITYTVSAVATASYAYAAFTADEPKYLNITSIQLVHGDTVDPVPLHDNATAPKTPSGENFTLTAFHVGQGMCSLFSNGKLGYLLDAGAGTPVTRNVYRKKTHRTGVPFINDLENAVAQHERLVAIISHADSDHWRLLEWDMQLLTMVEKVYLPAGEPALAFSSPAVKDKVIGIDDKYIPLGVADSVNIYRSQPSVHDKNGESLVVVVTCQGKKALYPGDYVYDRMAVDGNASIATLAESRFDAVIVPHHGDEASASVIPWPNVPDESQAFFSAGTHSGYGHPTNASLCAHESKGFVNIDRHTCSHIRAHPLLP